MRGSQSKTAALILRGKVTSGKGEGTKLTELAWVKRQINQRLGFSPYPGTLNIRLTPESTKQKQQLVNAKTTEITPENGYCTAKLFQAHIATNIKTAVILPQVSDYPAETLEIIAPVNLRQKLKLNDGDQITVRATLTSSSAL